MTPTSAEAVAGLVLWRCEVTNNPVGTDTVAVGYTCMCRGCRGHALAAEVEALKKERDRAERTLRYALEVAKDQEDHADSLASELAQCREADGWRPIVEAPRDGTRFDAWQPDRQGGRRICNVFWSDIQDWWCIESAWPDEPTPLAIEPAISHFRPLPPPPVTKEPKP